MPASGALPSLYSVLNPLCSVWRLAESTGSRSDPRIQPSSSPQRSDCEATTITIAINTTTAVAATDAANTTGESSFTVAGIAHFIHLNIMEMSTRLFPFASFMVQCSASRRFS
ncbi:uncharacterized protein LOC112494712 [Cephus cinctus]|uniref:Uncharacterized protein LOC112494712 n=1 Tax=Cephus cinctus TaxID=211228 RepID=A0AAJ7RMT4_CEPCN|nr:uncharacterized protein LOC112494712 [Cephus cinctus]